jgi:small ligand-binding sensory domain FIST
VARTSDALACDADLGVAAELAATDALGRLDAPPDLAVVFVCGSDPDDTEVALLRASELCGAATTVGATSAAGVLGGGRGVEQTNAVSVWAACVPDVSMRAFHLETMRTSESLAVLGLPERRAGDDSTLLLADPYSFPADGFVTRSNDTLPGLPLVGGLATGARGAGSTRLLLDQHVVDRGAVGVQLASDGAVRTMVSQGCRPIGPAMTVTAAQGNRLLELAGVPALTKLEDIVRRLGPDDQALITTGLQVGIAMDEYADDYGPGDFLVRGLVGVEQESDALVVGDLVEVGQTVQLQVRDAASAHDDLVRRLARLRAESEPDAESGALLFSCNGRGAGFFGRSDHDVAAVREGLDLGGVAGFFAAGEIGPVAGRNHVHALSASLLVLATG